MEKLSKSPADLQQEFYSKKFYLSYSGLSKMMYSPSLFYRHYVLQQKEDKLDSYLIDGKVIHCLLLDDGSFDKQFILLPSTLPTGNTKLVVDKVYLHYAEVMRALVDQGITSSTGQDLKDYEDTIIETLKEIGLHQSLKTDAQRVDKIITDESKSYFEFLKIRGDKNLIDSETLARCNDAVSAVRNNSTCSNLLGLVKHEMENIDIFNESHMRSDLEPFSFGIHGVTDNIKVDYDAKKVYVNDLKTTGKTISDFSETVEYYNYWAQAAMYDILVRDNFKDLLTEEWEVIIHFIVVDKYNQVYHFEVSKTTIKEWRDRLAQKLDEFKWHYTQKKYELPYRFATSQVIL